MNESPIIFHIRSLDDVDVAASGLLELERSSSVWLFEGQMGAGKTTLIKSICKHLGVQGTVQSPTFALVNEYGADTGQTIYHFDFYRIRHESEALDMGIEEYFDSGDLCLVEWPEKIKNLWPAGYMLLNLTMDENGDRVLTVTEHH